VTSKFTVLHVCTGNIGRSPLAEHLMRSLLQQRLGPASQSFVVASAGTYGCVGEPMESYSEQVLRERGIDTSDFRARALTAELIEQADLVLTATREHRSAVVGLVPGAVRRSFVLKELARLVEAVEEAERSAFEGADPAQSDLVSAARTRVDLAGRVRGLVERPDPTGDDIDDPIGEPLPVYVQLAVDMERANTLAVDLLLGPARPAGDDH
jgi:protein-tyrosine phosphatase